MSDRSGDSYCGIYCGACDIRLAGATGVCRVGWQPRIASANVHRGEEPPISGTAGSGTIFFSGCTLRCQFCQNFPISNLGNGETITTARLAEKMVTLQRRGAHNINCVTPTHFLPQILAALWLAIPQGFRLPLVWNSSGYEKVDALRLLDGVVDIYLPDMKYGDDRVATELSAAPGYPGVNRAAVTEMLRQVGHLRVDADGHEARILWASEPDVPILMAASGPRNLRLAGALADIVMMQVGVNPEACLREIKAYNQAVRADIPFNMAIKDGRCTEGLRINKSNWANRVDEPPFEAYAVTCGVTFSPRMVLTKSWVS